MDMRQEEITQNLQEVRRRIQRACERVGGVGDRYTCRINGQETYLWLENGKWFGEAKL